MHLRTCTCTHACIHAIISDDVPTVPQKIRDPEHASRHGGLANVSPLYGRALSKCSGCYWQSNAFVCHARCLAFDHGFGKMCWLANPFYIIRQERMDNWRDRISGSMLLAVYCKVRTWVTCRTRAEAAVRGPISNYLRHGGESLAAQVRSKNWLPGSSNSGFRVGVCLFASMQRLRSLAARSERRLATRCAWDWDIGCRRFWLCAARGLG